jgi:hypothetical protein
VEQLGNEKAEVRLGGIFALERLMRDSRGDQLTIVEVLCAYLRERSDRDDDENATRLGADIQAAVAVLGRRPRLIGEPSLNLQGVDLRRADLRAARFANADMRGANLREANLRIINLEGASLVEANLENAALYGANLRKANLSGSKLSGAHFGVEVLKDDHLSEFDTPEDMSIGGANLTRAKITYGSMTERQLHSAKGVDSVTWVGKDGLELPREGMDDLVTLYELRPKQEGRRRPVRWSLRRRK